jgi:hypothetical protein
VAAEDPTDMTDRSTKKGRPTPKRNEAEKARKERIRPILNRRDAMRRDRERRRTEGAHNRERMLAGDERYLPKRDQGPVRKFLRDYVDSRRTIAEFFLPIVLIILMISIMNAQIQVLATIMWLVIMLIMMADLTILGFRVKDQVRKRFPDDTSRGHVRYALTRSTQLRWLRAPKPTVKPGTLI